MCSEVRLLFSQVEQFVRLMLVCPVTSCSAERPFSSLRLLKRYTKYNDADRGDGEEMGKRGGGGWGGEGRAREGKGRNWDTPSSGDRFTPLDTGTSSA